MLHTDLGRHFDLGHVAAEDFGERAGRHRTSNADFALAADFRAGERGIEFVQNADRAGREQKSHDAVIVGIGDEPPVVMEHGRNDAGSPVGGGRHDASAGGVFLAHREGK